MANYEALKALIAARIHDNTEQEITAQDVRGSFDDALDAVNATKAELFDATYGVTTIDEVKAAVDAGKAVRLVYGEIVAPLVRFVYGGAKKGGAKAPEPGRDAWFAYSSNGTIYTYQLLSERRW